MTEQIVLPDSINNLIARKAFATDDVGMSDARVMVFDDCVLKESCIYSIFKHKKEPDASGSSRCNPKISTAILIYNILLYRHSCK